MNGQLEFDDAMDIRRLLRSRGIEPGDEAPDCDVCLTWKATHVVGKYMVCDKPRCQDRVDAVVAIEQGGANQ